jgi:hypothetical protein
MQSIQPEQRVEIESESKILDHLGLFDESTTKNGQPGLSLSDRWVERG